ncbi:hypothetical protein M8J76_007923 [Diaphorina citri]|nr:hypothetical protein M8J76_007923 [Diaphorina citri]
MANMLFTIGLICLQIILGLDWTTSQDFSSFGILFSSCQRFTPQFDDCVKDAINSVPEYNIPPFDPWYAEEVNQIRSGYKLKLKHVKEAGWQQSTITKFRANLEAGYIKFSQFFPEKYLEGEYITEAGGINKGVWNMTLYNYSQTMTIRQSKTDPTKLKVKVNIDKIGNLNMHISNLLRGRKRVENVLDALINSTWRMGFPLLKPLIEDLVATAFSKIYSDIFGTYNWELLFPF